MDPEVTLIYAYGCAHEGLFTEARHALRGYWEWRARGGFMPLDGDARARVVLDMISEGEAAGESADADDRDLDDNKKW